MRTIPKQLLTMLGEEMTKQTLANLKDRQEVWVEFMCWGQHCCTICNDEEAALRWCVSCAEQSFNVPKTIAKLDGTVLWDEDTLHDYIRERL